MRVIVLLIVDLLTSVVLFTIHLLPLLLVQVAAIRLAIRMNLLVDLRLPVLRAPRLVGIHLSAADAVGDTLLLVRLPLSNRARTRLVCLAVVLLVVDLLARAILLAVHLLPFLRSQRSTVRLPIRVHLLVDIRLSVLQVLRLTRRKLARADAIRDPLLLYIAPCTYRRHRHRLRTTMVHRSKLPAIRAHRLLVRHLVLRRLEVPLVERRLL
jgi:hypothetical protein